jgi:hypothetical protein
MLPHYIDCVKEMLIGLRVKMSTFVRYQLTHRNVYDNEFLTFE